MLRILAGLLVFVLLSVGDSCRAETVMIPNVTGIGTLGGTESVARHISENGEFITGHSLLANGNENAFLWTPSGGMVSLGTFGGTFSGADGASEDGSIIVGGSTYANGQEHAFRWTAATGLVDLGTLGGTFSYANKITPDGSVIVGIAALADGVQDAFRWTQAGGMVDLGNFGGTVGVANAVSNDGNVVVGASALANGNVNAFRWTQATGMVDIGTLGGTQSASYGVSGNGNVVTGYSLIPNGNTHVFLWTQSGGMIDLGTLGGTWGAGEILNSDGTVLIGESTTATSGSTSHAFRWTQASGMQDLNTLLANAGVNMTGITLTRALNMSQDTRFIVGEGIFPGYSGGEAYFAEYLAVPGTNTAIAGLTSSSAQAQATQQLADRLQTSQINHQALMRDVLGGFSGINDTNKVSTGGLFGSALGYVGGRGGNERFTFLGGVVYGMEDSPYIQEDGVVSFAAAVRYRLGDAKDTLRPYGEIGGWITPQETLTLDRPYDNGSGTATGEGDASAWQGAYYGRLGLIWDATRNDQLTGYGELGLQYLSFHGYTESLSPSNPFNAEVSPGTTRMDVGRAGLIYARQLGPRFTATLAGDVARGFDASSDVTATVDPLGSTTASANNPTWEEFGVALQAKVLDRLSVSVGGQAITGNNNIGTSLHGMIGLTYAY